VQISFDWYRLPFLAAGVLVAVVGIRVVRKTTSDSPFVRALGVLLIIVGAIIAALRYSP